jgi:hypothetical protein
MYVDLRLRVWSNILAVRWYLLTITDRTSDVGMLLLNIRGHFATTIGTLNPGISYARLKNLLTSSHGGYSTYPQNDQYDERVMLFLPAECMVCFMVVSCRSPTRIVLSVGALWAVGAHWDIRYDMCCQ